MASEHSPRNQSAANPTQATLNRLLQPFRLRLSLSRIRAPEGPVLSSIRAPGRDT